MKRRHFFGLLLVAAMALIAPARAGFTTDATNTPWVSPDLILDNEVKPAVPAKTIQHPPLIAPNPVPPSPPAAVPNAKPPAPAAPVAGSSPTPYLTPAEEAKKFVLQDGYRLELVVSDPIIKEP